MPKDPLTITLDQPVSMGVYDTVDIVGGNYDPKTGMLKVFYRPEGQTLPGTEVVEVEASFNFRGEFAAMAVAALSAKLKVNAAKE